MSEVKTKKIGISTNNDDAGKIETFEKYKTSVTVSHCNDSKKAKEKWTWDPQNSLSDDFVTDMQQ